MHPSKTEVSPAAEVSRRVSPAGAGRLLLPGQQLHAARHLRLEYPAQFIDRGQQAARLSAP